MTELQKRILDYITANQPVTEAQGKKAMGISRYAYRAEIRQMANLGMVCIKNGSGAFRDEASYQEWLDRIGSKIRAHRIISARDKCKRRVENGTFASLNRRYRQSRNANAATRTGA